jgi:predicted ester cyclase
MKLLNTMAAAAALALTGTSGVGAVFAATLKVDDIVHSNAKSSREVSAEKAAMEFYDFWNTGDAMTLKKAISPTFVDHTLPPGRPQGPDGPAFASRNFREAVPDLSVEVRKMVFSGDYVTVHMVFRGHFSGVFGAMKGSGQSIEFIATDLLKITDGLVTDNWHIEDNLTLLQQMKIVKQ